MATQTLYVPSSSGVAKSSASLSGSFYFRLLVSQNYNPTTNVSTLTFTPQVKFSNFAPKDFYFASKTIGSTGVITVNGSQVAALNHDDNSFYKPLNSNLNDWVNVGKNGSAYSFSVSVTHEGNGSKSITVAFNSMYVRSYDDRYYVEFPSQSMSLNISMTRSFTLTTMAAAGSTISVTKSGTPVSGTVNYGDVLTISASASTGYDLMSLKVNGADFVSGHTLTVTGAVSVVTTATKKTFSLSISQGSNSTITVKRGSTTLVDGSMITYGDVLTITMTAATGYHLTTATVTNATQSGNNYTVTGAVVVTTVAAGNSKTLHLTPGTGTTVTVKRSGVELQNNANISVGDVLVITVAAAAGYQNATASVTGATKSGDNYTVTDNVYVTSSASKISYTLTLSPATGSSITVLRGTETLQSGATIYYGDILRITAAAASGYEVKTLTVNGSGFANGGNYEVKSAVAVATTAEELVGAYLYIAAQWARYAAYIYGAAWNRYIPYIKTTNGWVKY